MSWHAVFGKTGTENTIEQYIQYHFGNSDCKTFVPKRRVTEVRRGKAYPVLKTLFPGYVLIKTSMDASKYNIIKTIPQIYTIVSQGGEYCSEIKDEEIETILNLVSDGDIIDYSQVLIEDSKIYVTSGPLTGMEGLIQRIDKRRGRAKVILNFMGDVKKIDLGVEIIKPFN